MDLLLPVNLIHTLPDEVVIDNIFFKTDLGKAMVLFKDVYQRNKEYILPKLMKHYA